MGILLFVLIGVGIYFIFFNNGESNIKLANNKSAEEKLKERFVNGEIDEETYMKMKEALKH